MRVRLLALLVAVAAALALLTAALALAQGPVDEAAAEAHREAALAAAAEANPTAGLPPAAPLSAPAAVITPVIFAGVDNAATMTTFIDPATGDAGPLFNGFRVWGAAYDAAREQVYFNGGTTLYIWPIGNVPGVLGLMRSAASDAPLTMAGLAFHDGVLYGSRTIASAADPEGIYVINPATRVATSTITFADDGLTADIGGLDFDPQTGTLYGLNDHEELRGLVRIAPSGQLTLLAPYPPGENDLDGLAVGGGRAYLIPDEPGDIYVFDLATLRYTTPLPAPWAEGESFAGATWLAEPPPLGPAIALAKTVSVDPGQCGSGSTIEITPGQSVTYCFTVTNTGDTPFAFHDLVDSHLGGLLSGEAFDLPPGTSHTISRTVTLTTTTTNTATWTAYNAGQQDESSATATAMVMVLAPEIDVSPATLSAQVAPGEQATAMLTIGNSGTAQLDWSLSLAPETCATPGALPWVTVAPPSGLTPPADNSLVEVTFDAAGLASGDYSGILCVSSNDADEPLVAVELRLVVGRNRAFLPFLIEEASTDFTDYADFQEINP